MVGDAPVWTYSVEWTRADTRNNGSAVKGRCRRGSFAERKKNAAGDVAVRICWRTLRRIDMKVTFKMVDRRKDGEGVEIEVLYHAHGSAGHGFVSGWWYRMQPLGL